MWTPHRRNIVFSVAMATTPIAMTTQLLIRLYSLGGQVSPK